MEMLIFRWNHSKSSTYASEKQVNIVFEEGMWYQNLIMKENMMVCNYQTSTRSNNVTLACALSNATDMIFSITPAVQDSITSTNVISPGRTMEKRS